MCDEREEETAPCQTGLRRPGENLTNCHRETNVTAPLLDSTHVRFGMTDSFGAAELARKRRQKWWSHHIPLAYAVLISLFLAIYLGVAFVDRHITGWLNTLGVSPSGVNLLIGTVSCGLGIWGIRSRRGLGTAWVVIFAWCLLSGIVAVAKAFSFF